MKPISLLLNVVLLTSACFVAVAGPVPTSATFAQGFQQSASQDFHLVDTGSGVTLTASSQIYFVFSNVTVPPGLTGPLSATLTFNLASSQPALLNPNTGVVSEDGFSGTFSIILNTPFDGQTNLLSGTVTSGANATLAGKSGGTSASLSGSTPPPGAVTYNSAFVQFPNPATNAFSLALSSVVPSFVENAQGYLAPFDAAGAETFSADSVVAPEPGSMLLVGFQMLLIGLIAFRIRRFLRH